MSTCKVCHIAPGQCCCTCVYPPVPLCTSCVVAHITFAGAHIVQPLVAPPSQPPASESCSICLTALVELFCVCREKAVPLCRKCVNVHNAESTERLHHAVPSYAGVWLMQPGYIDRLTTRMRNMKNGLAEANRNIGAVDSCLDTLLDKLDKVMKEVSMYRDKMQAQLRSYRRKLEATINKAQAELEQHIYEDDYVPREILAKAILNHTPGQLKLFSYKPQGFYQIKVKQNLEPKDAKKLPKKQKAAKKISAKPNLKNATVPEPHWSNTLIYLNRDTIALSDIKTGSLIKISSLSITGAVSQMSSAVLLPEGRLFVCGKEQPISSFACEIEIESGFVSPVASMQDPRFGHGILLYASSVYVFGGTGQKELLAASEAFSRESRSWVQLASMKSPRDLFNPCEHNSFVYIFGGRKTTACEVYDLFADCFSLLPFVMPGMGQTSSAVISEGEVLVLQQGLAAKWRVGEATFAAQTTGGISGSCWGNMNPIVNGDFLHISLFNMKRFLKITISSLFPS